jgi:hypothetical protein
MSDGEYAHQALSALERIDAEGIDQAVRDAHTEAVAAVDEFVAALGQDDKVSVETPKEWADDEDD